MSRSACLLPVVAIGLAPTFASMGCSDETGDHGAVTRVSAARSEPLACNNVSDGKVLKPA
jgi:hypothetical protein